MRRKVQTCRAAAPIRADRMQVAACRDFEPVKVKNAGTVVPIECTLLSLLHCSYTRVAMTCPMKLKLTVYTYIVNRTRR